MKKLIVLSIVVICMFMFSIINAQEIESPSVFNQPVESNCQDQLAMGQLLAIKCKEGLTKCVCPGGHWTCCDNSKYKCHCDDSVVSCYPK